MNTKYTSHIYKGCFIAVVYIFLDTLIFYNKAINNHFTDFVAWAIIVGGALVSVYLYAKNTDTTTTFGGLFAHGFKTTAVATCFIFIYFLAKVYIVDNKGITDSAIAGIENLKKQGVSQLPSIDEVKKIIRLTTIAGNTLATLFLGIVGSVLGSVIASSKFINKKN